MPDISTPNLDYNDMVEAWDIHVQNLKRQAN